MTKDELRRGLEKCATEIERGIAEFYNSHERDHLIWGDIPAEARATNSGEPILAGMYAGLADVYRALASPDLFPPRRGRQGFG